jgi:uncharacterized phage protein gp47/JayE
MAYGYDPATGYQPATVAELLAEIEAEQLTDIDAALDVSPDEPVGQLNGIFATKIAKCHELTQTAFQQFDDTKCEGTQLQAIAALTGTFKKAATKGTVTLNCQLTIGTTLLTTHVANVLGDDTNRWTPKAAFTAPSTGVHAVVFECERTGAVEALAGTITVITTALAGWSSVTNPLDATPGIADEKDSALRLRRRAELRAQGACSVPAIAADLLKVTGVITARCYENTTMAVDLAGRPAKSIHAVVWDGIAPAAADADIRDVIFKNKPGGVATHGSVVGSVTDEFGKVHNILFDRATQRPISIAVTLVKDADTYAGDAAVETALMDAGALYTMDQDVVYERIKAVVMGVKGVEDITSLTIWIAPAAPGTVNIPIGETQIATFDTSRTTVTS